MDEFDADFSLEGVMMMQLPPLNNNTSIINTGRASYLEGFNTQLDKSLYIKQAVPLCNTKYNLKP
jgi:hypothetical protein